MKKLKKKSSRNSQVSPAGSSPANSTLIKKTMETKRREILDKWFAAFQLSIGLPNEPLTDHAAEYLEAAMQEYADLNSK